MDSLISTFHIDYKLLLAQIINFSIVFSVLYFFAFKPLVKIMKEREKKIEDSVEEARKIKEKLANTEADYKIALDEARKEANQIIGVAKDKAIEEKKKMLEKAKDEIGQIINEEKMKMNIEKAKTLKEIKKDVAGMIVSSLEKILEEKIDDKKEKELLSKIISK